jgi:hypothetical protein
MDAEQIELVRGQDGVFTRAQWRAAGEVRGVLDAQLAARRWQTLNESVMVAHNGPLTDRQRQWAAVLSAQAPVAVCGLTALANWGLRGWADEAVHVVVRRGARMLPVKGVTTVVHESRRFHAHDVVDRRPPCTSLERSVVDAAAWSPSAWTAFRIVIAAVQQRLTTADRLLETLAAAGQVRHCRQLRHLLADVSGGAEALSEVAFLRWCRRHALPRPMLQVRTDTAGRRRYLDAEFRRRDGGTLWVEVDGGVHLTLDTRWEDAVKDNDAWLAGRRSLRLISAAIYADDVRALRQVRQALGLPTLVSA